MVISSVGIPPSPVGQTRTISAPKKIVGPPARPTGPNNPTFFKGPAIGLIIRPVGTDKSETKMTINFDVKNIHSNSKMISLINGVATDIKKYKDK